MAKQKQILKDALSYMANMYGLKLSICRFDKEIEYSCNGYVVDRETYLVLKQAAEIIDWWE